MEEPQQYLAIALSDQLSPRGGLVATPYTWMADSGTWLKDAAWTHGSDIITGVSVAVQSVGTAMTSRAALRDSGETVAIIGNALNGAKGLYDMGSAYRYMANRQDGSLEVIPESRKVAKAAALTGAGGLVSTASAVIGALGESKLFNDSTRASMKTAAIVGAYVGSALSWYGPKSMEATQRLLRTWIGEPISSSPLPMSRNESTAYVARQPPVADAGSTHARHPVREPEILPAVHAEPTRGGGHTRK
ncbi:hypothetical protein [Streptomyces bauhiniae]